MDGTFFFFFFAIRINYERLKIVFLMFLCSQGLRHCFVGRSHRYGIGGASWEVQGLSQTEGQKVCQQNHLGWVKRIAQS